MLVFPIKLTETYRHLSATRSWSSDNDQRALRLHEVVFAKTLVGSNQSHIVRVSFNEIMDIGFDAHPLQSESEIIGRPLSFVVSNDDRSHHKSPFHESGSKSQHVLIVSDAKVSPCLVAFDILCTDDDDDFDTVAQLLQHT